MRKMPLCHRFLNSLIAVSAGLELGRCGGVTTLGMLFFRSLACHFVPGEVCSLDPSVIIRSGAPQSFKNSFKASSHSLFFAVGHASTNICLSPNTWQCRIPCNPSQRGSMVSDAVSLLNLIGSNIPSTLCLLDEGIAADRACR